MGSILLVEADVATSDEWSAALASSGHEVLTASGMREALHVVREGGIDVVVIDVYDPRAGVLELARGMDALPDAPSIVLISGSPAAPEISARIGAATFLAKPCEPSEVVTAVGRLLGRLRPVRILDDEPSGPTEQFG
ncbi:MAG TPA: response regulator [Kofleriaceae bacterium]|nr:response regulator [Kofleriaceae bacterium]